MTPAEMLELSAKNNSADHARVTHAIRQLRHALDLVAESVAKFNAGWNDDPTDENYALHHAPACAQFPRHVRDEVALELVRYYLSEWALEDEQKRDQ